MGCILSFGARPVVHRPCPRQRSQVPVGWLLTPACSALHVPSSPPGADERECQEALAAATAEARELEAALAAAEAEAQELGAAIAAEREEAEALRAQLGDLEGRTAQQVGPWAGLRASRKAKCRQTGIA